VTYQTYTKKGTNPPIYKYSTVPVTDRRNNVVALVYTTGIDTGSIRAYDLHGREANPASGTLYMPYRFAGRQWDAESDLYYNRSRYYDPSLGRFISLDTIGIWGDLNNYGNGYAYVGNMGNSGMDPWGTRGASQKIQDTYDWVYGIMGVYHELAGCLMQTSTTPDVNNVYYKSPNQLVAERSFDRGIAIIAIAFVVGEKIIEVGLEMKTNDLRNKWVAQINQKIKNTMAVVASNAVSDEGKLAFLEATLEQIKALNQKLCGADYCQWDPKKKQYVRAPEPTPTPTPGEGNGTGEGGTEGQSNNQLVDEDSGPKRGEDFLWMSATGRIKAKPKKKNDIREYPYEKIPFRALLKFREQKNKRNLDGRGPVFSWWKFQAPVVNWNNRMGLLPKNRSGVIDPID
jgi:RHS repeat-associated protein